MLKLCGTDVEGASTILYFDQQTFTFYFDELGAYPVPTDSSYNATANNTVIIPLGYDCPNNCVYCTQKDMRDKPFDPWKLTSSINNLNKYISNIHFLGGEPLLRFDYIKHIVKLFPSITYSIVTNGRYITSEVMEFFLDHKFYVTLSHDGGSHYLSRGSDDILKTYKRRYMQQLAEQGELQIASVLYGDVDTLYDRYMYFKDMDIPFKYIDITSVIPFTEHLNDLIVGKDDYSQHLTTTLNDIYKIDEVCKEHLGGDHEILHLMYKLLHNKNTKYDMSITRCPIFNSNITTMSPNGDRQYCYNSTEAIDCTITDKLMVSDNYLKCASCPVCLLCTSGCRLVTDTQHTHICNRAFYRYIAYFKFFVRGMFNFDITSIEGEFHHAEQGSFRIS